MCYWAGPSPLLPAWVCPHEKCNMRHQNDGRYRLQGKKKELNSALCFPSTWYQGYPFYKHHPLGSLRTLEEEVVQGSILRLWVKTHTWMAEFMLYRKPHPGTLLNASLWWTLTLALFSWQIYFRCWKWEQFNGLHHARPNLNRSSYERQHHTSGSASHEADSHC